MGSTTTTPTPKKPTPTLSPQIKGCNYHRKFNTQVYEFIEDDVLVFMDEDNDVVLIKGSLRREHIDYIKEMSGLKVLTWSPILLEKGKSENSLIIG